MKIGKTVALEVSWENRSLCATRAEWWLNPARADRPKVWATITRGGRVTQFPWYARPVLGCWCHTATVTRTHVRPRRDGMQQYSTVVRRVTECGDTAQCERERGKSMLTRVANSESVYWALSGRAGRSCPIAKRYAGATIERRGVGVL